MTEPRKARFGLFELDLETGDLLREGRAVKIQRRPAMLLTLLVERAGELVTREEIIEVVWADRVVDYDQAINFAMRQLRAALGDSVESPAFIETVPRRGYRFVAPIGIPEVAPVPRGRQRSVLLWALPGFALLVIAVVLIGLGLREQDDRVFVAVLPFSWDDADTINVARSETLARDLAGALAAVAPERIGVVAAGSVERLMQEGYSTERARDQLGVDYVVEGSLVHEDSLAVLRTELVDATDETLVWSERYQRVGAILNLEGEVAFAVARAILPDSPERGVLVGSHPASAGSDALVLGRYLMYRHTMQDTRSAIAQLEKALELDPELSEARAYLAEAMFRMGESDSARALATRVLSEDPTSAVAKRVLGSYELWVQQDPEAAVTHLADAVAAAPGQSEFMHSLAWALALAGRTDEAIVQMREAGRRDPLSPALAADFGGIFIWGDRFREAVGTCTLSLELNPESTLAAECIVRARVQLSDLRNAAASLTTLLELRGADSTTTAEVGRMRPPDALVRGYSWLRDHYRARFARGDDVGVRLARYCAALDERDCALEGLRDAAQRNSTTMMYARFEPEFDRYRGDAEFDELLGAGGSG